MKYEKPVVRLIGLDEKGAGQNCHDGSGNPDLCDNGNVAPGTCIYGPAADICDDNGTSPTSECASGESAPACFGTGLSVG